MKIGTDILQGFNLQGEINTLSGGQDTSIKVKDAALKPVNDNEELTQWSLNIFSKVNPHGYRISKPIISNDGTFVYKGWCCTHYEVGNEVQGHIKEKLKVSRMLHKDLRNVKYSKMPKANDPWSRSQRIAWQQEPLPTNICNKAKEILSWLLLNVTLKDCYKFKLFIQTWQEISYFMMI